VTISFSTSVDVPYRRNPLAIGLSLPDIASGPIPVVLFSHGAGLTGEDYGPLADALTGGGFAVIRPTHPSVAEPLSDLPAWRGRAMDLRALIDGFETLERALPGADIRFDRNRIFVVGHSYGGHTAQLLLGARVNGMVGVDAADVSDPRVKAGVLLAAPGAGGADNLTPEWLARAPYLDLDWSAMHRPALVVAGGNDLLVMSVHDWTWRTDSYRSSPGGNKSLLVLTDADHYLGGIVPGRGAADPAALRITLDAITAYLRHAAFPGDPAWPILADRLRAGGENQSRLEQR
jgi:dienelactone hydrolase